MPTEKTAAALKGLKDLRARIVSQERERTRHRIPGSPQESTEGGGPRSIEPPAAGGPAAVEAIPEVATPVGIPKDEIRPTENDAPPRAPDMASIEPPRVGDGRPTVAEPDPSVSSARDPERMPPPPANRIDGGTAAADTPDSSAPSESWRAVLDGHCHPQGWTAETLLPLLLEETLGSRQPAIQQGGTLIASSDRCRFLRCPPGSTHALLRSDRGAFELHPKATSPRWSHWRRHYELLGYPPVEAKQAARRRTLLELLEHLRAPTDFRIGRWIKQVSPDDFLVVRQPHA